MQLSMTCGAACRAAELHPQHGAETVFELRGVRAFDRPVAGVVDAGRHFVGDQVVALHEKFDGEHADVIEFCQDGFHVVLCL